MGAERQGAPAFTSGWILRRAFLVFVITAAMHWLGLREYTSIFSGTVPDGVNRLVAVVLGVTYAAAYLATVILVPIAVIASGLAFLLEARARSRSRP